MGRRHEETLFQRRHPDGQQTNKKMLNVTHHQGNTTTLRYYLTLVRVAKMNKSGGYRCWGGCGETGTLLHCWCKCKMVPPLWKTVWRFLKKLKIDVPYDPAIALLGIYPRDTGVLMHRGTYTAMFRVAVSTIAKLWKEPKCPSTLFIIQRMDKEDVVYIYN